VGKIERGRVLIGNNVGEARSSIEAGHYCEEELAIIDFDVKDINSISCSLVVGLEAGKKVFYYKLAENAIKYE
jgi:hypothetical protein